MMDEQKLLATQSVADLNNMSMNMQYEVTDRQKRQISKESARGI